MSGFSALFLSSKLFLDTFDVGTELFSSVVAWGSGIGVNERRELRVFIRTGLLFGSLSRLTFDDLVSSDGSVSSFIDVIPLVPDNRRLSGAYSSPLALF